MADHVGGGVVRGPRCSCSTWARIVAALAGAVSVYLVGRIGERWMGWVGGLVAALIVATVPTVVGSDTMALQEPFVVLAVLLAYRVWSAREPTDRRGLVVAGLLVGVAISIKLVAGLFLVPLLVAGPFARPVWDRLRVAVPALVPLAVTGGAAAIVVGWREPFRQAVLAELSRPAQQDGIPRVVTLLPLPGADVGSHAGALQTIGWVALVLFGIACIATIVWGGRDRAALGLRRSRRRERC